MNVGRNTITTIFCRQFQVRAFSAFQNSRTFAWGVAPGRGPQPSISAGVRDYYISRLWRWDSEFSHSLTSRWHETWHARRTTSILSSGPWIEFHFKKLDRKTKIDDFFHRVTSTGKSQQRHSAKAHKQRQSFSSAWEPLREPLFRALWIAAVASNVGTWMEDVGEAWLMTSLSASTLMVALVETAGSLPIVLLAVPSGAFADIIDRQASYRLRVSDRGRGVRLSRSRRSRETGLQASLWL